MPGARTTKYNARRVRYDGHVFDSVAERRRYHVLKLKQELGEISGLTVHPSWTLEVNGQKVGVYSGDFWYWDHGVPVLEDVKSPPTRRRADYQLRKRLLKALYGIDVREIEA